MVRRVNALWYGKLAVVLLNHRIETEATQFPSQLYFLVVTIVFTIVAYAIVSFAIVAYAIVLFAIVAYAILFHVEHSNSPLRCGGVVVERRAFFV